MVGTQNQDVAQKHPARFQPIFFRSPALGRNTSSFVSGDVGRLGFHVKLRAFAPATTIPKLSFHNRRIPVRRQDSKSTWRSIACFGSYSPSYSAEPKRLTSFPLHAVPSSQQPLNSILMYAPYEEVSPHGFALPFSFSEQCTDWKKYISRSSRQCALAETLNYGARRHGMQSKA